MDGSGPLLPCQAPAFDHWPGQSRLPVARARGGRSLGRRSDIASCGALGDGAAMVKLRLDCMKRLNRLCSWCSWIGRRARQALSMLALAYINPAWLV